MNSIICISWILLYLLSIDVSGVFTRESKRVLFLDILMDSSILKNDTFS